ncbi:hypothetical protein, partial [Terribacillus sp. AE2B 122]
CITCKTNTRVRKRKRLKTISTKKCIQNSGRNITISCKSIQQT